MTEKQGPFPGQASPMRAGAGVRMLGCTAAGRMQSCRALHPQPWDRMRCFVKVSRLPPLSFVLTPILLRDVRSDTRPGLSVRRQGRGP